MVPVVIPSILGSIFTVWVRCSTFSGIGQKDQSRQNR
ncbi:AcrZ family multidrug efflux pump-associated protein [Salmonella enterica subsp. enterica]|nr:AcrZ family multidrug efflux pump-associated protein [Salmonella enterica subsp. enterica]